MGGGVADFFFLFLFFYWVTRREVGGAGVGPTDFNFNLLFRVQTQGVFFS